MRRPRQPDQPELFTPAPLPVAALDARGRLACLRLIRSENVGPVTFRELINRFGSAEAALDALPDIARRSGRVRPLRLCPVGAAEAELLAAEKAGAFALFTVEPGYPAALAAIEVPPPLLYARGSCSALARDMVAVVGSRECSAAGVTMTRLLSRGLGDAGYVVVSGLARGIDSAAHRTALEAGTVAVLAGGIDHVYPPENRDLFDLIPERGGAIVTELPPGYQPRAQDFPRRNRIITGMARGVVIVEAARRSGALVSARYAGEQGREVFAVPGSPLDPRAEGTNRLIRDGAKIVTCVEDILVELGPITGRSPVSVAEQPGPVPTAPAPARQPDPATKASDDVADDAIRDTVLAALGPAPVNIDTLVRATGLLPRSVQIALMELDLAGLIERQGGQLVSRRVPAD